jgi:ATP-dependent Clp protease ATP-binding subunit ClpA
MAERAKTSPLLSRSKRPAAESPGGLRDMLATQVVGQFAATSAIVPYIQMFQADLAPEGRPVGVFLLLGPTGTGKTRTAEVLAEALHGSSKNLLKIDCGEFQMEHEVAKLVGAPPGYLGHRETQPMLSQQRLNAAASEHSELSVVLFDEIEKAAPSMTRLLLGVLDKAALRLGDNTTVNFEKSVVFLTSNLGAREMMHEIAPDFGFQAGAPAAHRDVAGKLERVGMAAVRKKFSPEFVNRIDCVITYQPLGHESLSLILDQQIDGLRKHVETRLGPRGFAIEVSEEAREFLLRNGASPRYGARELNRTIHRHLTQPLAAMVAEGRIEPGARVHARPSVDGESLDLAAHDPAGPAPPLTVLIADDNEQLLAFLRTLMAAEGWSVLLAEAASKAKQLAAENAVDCVLLDNLLPDGSGVSLAAYLRRIRPHVPILVMSGRISEQEERACQSKGFPFVQKPFDPRDLIGRMRRSMRTGPIAA